METCSNTDIGLLFYKTTESNIRNSPSFYNHSIKYRKMNCVQLITLDWRLQCHITPHRSAAMVAQRSSVGQIAYHQLLMVVTSPDWKTATFNFIIE
jgi:hypothetical protein